MSLNGLETLEVNDAYQSALGEAGGWFLLKYLTRDEVGLFGRGSGGLAELQETVNRYEEQSPLFGFILYRRRKVLLKYVPEGTSRILQARVSVHFQSVTEKVAPHDTIFSFSKTAELHDAALSSACSLHTATASIKSPNDSIPPTSLAGITEDVSESRVNNVEEPGNNEKLQRISLLGRDSGDSQTRGEKVKGDTSAQHVHEKSPSITTQRSLQRARTISSVDKALPPIPKDIVRGNLADGHDRISNEKSAPRSSPNYSENETKPAGEARVSSQSTRPSSRDLYDAYGYKQKVKLGPRPSSESTNRPDNVDRTNNLRPVATLPAGLRMPPRKMIHQKAELVRPQSQQSHRTFASGLSQREKLPMAPVTPLQIPDRKVPLVYKGLLTPVKTPVDSNSPKITPEKRRLMKALQLRQKQLAAQKPTTGVECEEIPVKSEDAKPELDDSILSAISYASNPETDPDIVHMSVKDLSREDPRNVEASPISIPETSDGPSTQASSFTDEEDLAAQENQLSKMDESTILSHCHSLDSKISDSDGSHELSVDRKTNMHQVPQEHHQPTGARASPEQSAFTQPNQSVKQSSLMEDESSAKHADLQRKAKAIDVADNSQVATSISSVMTKEEMSNADLGKHEEKAVPTPSSIRSLTWGDSPFATKKHAPSTMDPCPESTFPEERHSAQSDIAPMLNTEVLVLEVGDENQPVTRTASPKAFGPSLARDALYPWSSPLGNHGKVVKSVSNQVPSPHKTPDQVNPLEVPLRFIGEDTASNATLHGSPPQSLVVSPSSATQLESPSSLSQVKRQSQDSELTATRLSTSDTVSEEQAERQARRRGVVNSQQRLSSPEHSDEQFLSDDSFMEELKSAILQEAKPISVSKSPIKPVFSRSDSDQRFADAMKANRSVSSPLNQPSKDEELLSTSRPPTSLSSRSFSANQAPRSDNQQAAATMPKKLGVSSGISQRIKALEQLSTRPSSPQSLPPPNASAFITQRKSSFRSPHGTSDPKVNPSNKSRPNSAYQSPSPSPEAVKSNPFNNLVQTGPSPPESISVTATIVRDARNKTPETPSNPAKPRAIDLHRSPLVVEHQKMTPPPLSPPKPPRPPYARYHSARSGFSLSTEQKVEVPQTTRRGSFASILSRSYHAGSEAELPRSLSDSSIIGIVARGENGDDKKDSKRSRLKKRMSSISSMSRRSIANALSPSPKEAPIVERQELITETPLVLVEVGDVNVQFPDTLLWKRRHMIIDEQGVLILSASKADNNSKIPAKKYPISNFRSPYIPDQDRQELPNSVVLDFRDGSTLQCACEHPQGQAGVLQGTCFPTFS